MNKIFISMGSYDEKYLYQTVKSAISNAKYPDDVVIGIHNVYPDEASYSFGEYSNQVRFLNLKYSNPLGTGYGRLSASLLCPKDCKYILQVDAHMLFEKNWDEDIVFRYNEIKKDHEKVIITKYLMHWNEIDGRPKLFINNKYEDCDPYNMDRCDPEFNVPASLQYADINTCANSLFPIMAGYQGDWKPEDTYLEQLGVSGHFMFSESNIIKDILYDPLIPWASDEVTFSLRAFTRGYKIVTIRENIAWHMDKKFKMEPASGIDFKEYADEYKRKLADEYDQFDYSGIRRIKDLLLGDELGFWGAPDKESLQKYYEFSNIDFVELYEEIKRKLIREDKIKILHILYDII